jgi:Ca2+-binding EF-hand superfamily protein
MCQTKPADTFWEDMGYGPHPSDWSEEERYAVAEKIFDQFDKDNNDCIDLEELVYMIIEIDKHTMTFGRPERVYNLAMHQMKEYDLNGDEYLSREEFLPFFVECIIGNGFENFKDFDWDKFEEDRGINTTPLHH